MRLDKYITACGAATRSEVKKLIKAGAVTVDGVLAKAPDMRVDEKSVKVCISGTELRYIEFVYLMLNKPQGYISATFDKHYPIVTELVPQEFAHLNVFPVGRLDIDTEGLLILTNDGQYDHEVTSPKKNVYKRYFARLDAAAQESDIEEFAKGMEFSDFCAKPAKLEICADPHEVFIEIAEGKFHQVKRMCAKVGKNVVYLRRESIGALKLDSDLELGEIREMDADEARLALCGGAE